MNRNAVPNATLGFPGKPANGGSEPRFYDFDDGVVRLVKWHPSRHGSKPCLNELVASRLGQLLDAPILRGCVVYVPDAVIPAEHRAIGAAQGFHFGVARMEGENFVPASHYSEIANSAELPYAAVFLTWLAVGDQESHNQYLHRVEERDAAGQVRTTKRFQLIDMGQMFGDFNWRAETLAPIPGAYKLPTHLAANLTLAQLTPALSNLMAIDQADIRTCFDDWPASWAIPEPDRQAAIERLLNSRERVEQMLKTGNPSIQ